MSFMDDDYEVRPLYILRFEADPENGIRLEDCTRKRRELKLATYCGFLLAEQDTAKTLRKFRLVMDEFGEGVNCRCLVDKKASADVSSFIDMHTGYSYTPYGPGAEGFGYLSGSTAWMIPHQAAPCIWWVDGDLVSEGRVMRWIDGFAARLSEATDEDLTWPSRNEENDELVVPEGMEQKTLMLPGIGIIKGDLY